jgi:hypothetical protein
MIKKIIELLNQLFVTYTIREQITIWWDGVCFVVEQHD